MAMFNSYVKLPEGRNYDRNQKGAIFVGVPSWSQL